MDKEELQENRLKLITFDDKAKFKEEMVLKEIVDNLVMSLIMTLDAIEEVDGSRIFGDLEKRSLYVDILDALEYSIDVSLGGRDAFMEGMDLNLEEFIFIKRGE